MDSKSSIQQSLFNMFWQNTGKSLVSTNLDDKTFSEQFFNEILSAAANKTFNRSQTEWDVSKSAVNKSIKNIEKYDNQVKAKNQIDQKPQVSDANQKDVKNVDGKEKSEKTDTADTADKKDKTDKTAISKDKKNLEVNETSDINETSDVDGISTDGQDVFVGEGKDITDVIGKMLGISSDEFSSMMAFLNISPEDLALENKQDEVISKISEFIGLDKEQENVLTKMIKGIDFQATKEANPVELENQKDWVKVKGIEVVQVSGEKDSVDFEELKQKVKSKVEEFANGFKAAKGEIAESTLDSTAGIEESVLQEQNKDKKQINIKNDNEINDKTVEDDKVSGIKVNTNANEKSSQGSLTNDLSNGFKKDAFVKTEMSDNEEVKVFSGIIGDHKGNMVKAVEAANRAGNTQKNEIVNQVLEKAKVLLNGDKSEMVMDLKPDSLGKLSLKVVTERGIVMAKFVAENEQVKATLETNMQILKDALEKQGLSVQGFSVSVGNNNLRDNNSNNQYDLSSSKSINKKIKDISKLSYRDTEISNIMTAENKVSQYMTYGSTVNFIA